MLLRNNKHFLESKTEQAIPKEGLPFNFTVKDIAPR
jgi:hypothetical protein